MHETPPTTPAATAEFSLPYSYCGLLDDVVARYDPAYQSPGLFNRLLVKSLFFGGGLYINDGYLFMHTAAREQMKDPDSVLCKMLEYGFVKIFSRTSSLDALITLVDNSDVPSHIDFRNSPDWARLRQRWAAICENAWKRGHVIPWGSPRNHKIQSKLYQRILGSEPANLGLSCPKSVLDRINELLFIGSPELKEDLNPYAGAARTKYETACLIAVKEAKPTDLRRQQMVRELMRLANETYHYAFGASLSWQYGKPVAVDTTISPAFDELIRRPHIDYRKFESIPAFGIPNNVDLTRGEDLEPLMYDSKAFHAKVRFVQNFVDQLRVEDSSTSDWQKGVKEAAEAYASELTPLLRHVDVKMILNGNGNYQIALARSVTNSYDAAATPLPSVSAAIVREDGAVFGDCVVKYSIPEEDKISSWRFTGQEIVPQVSSLAFHKSIVNEILDDEYMLNDKVVREGVK